MLEMGLQLSQGASLFGSRGLTLRPCSGQADGEAGGWAWGCGGTGEVAPVGVNGATRLLDCQQRCWLMEKMLPSGSLMPRVLFWAEGYFLGWRTQRAPRQLGRKS